MIAYVNDPKTDPLATSKSRKLSQRKCENEKQIHQHANEA